MAGDAVVGALRVVLGMDTGAFDDAAKKASKELDGFAKGFVKVGAVIAGALTVAVAGFVAGIKGAIDSADELGKAAQKIGIPVKALSELKFAAELADVSFDTLSTSVARLSKNMADVASGAAGPAAKAFEALDINVKRSDGTLKSSTEIMKELAESFSGLEDGAAKTALAMAIFGKAGKEMIPLLNAGASGLEKAAEEARKFGLVISEETAKSAEEFNDNLKRLERAATGVTVILAAKLLPVMEDLSRAFVNFARESNGTSVVAQAVEIVFRGLAVSATLLAGRFINLANSFKLLFDLAKNINSLEGMKKAFDDFSKANATANVSTNETVAALLGLHKTILPVIDDWNQLSIIVNSKPLKPAPIIEMKDALDKFLESTRQSITAQRAEIASHGQSDAAKARAKVVYEGLAKAAAGNIPITDELRRSLNLLGAGAAETAGQLQALKVQDAFTGLKAQTMEVQGAFNNLAPGFVQQATSLGMIRTQADLLRVSLGNLTAQEIALNVELQKLKQAQITEEFLLPWQKYEQEMQKLKATFGEAGQETDAFKAKALKNATDLALAYGMAAQSIVSPFADAFKTLASMNKKYAAAAKAAAIGEALVNTYLAATKAYATVPPPFNVAAAAAAVAAGLANVAKISATDFQTGGSFKVGGAGGVDSQLISFKASPGEMVDVRRPDSRRGGAGMVQTIELKPPNPRDFFVQHVRELVETLNAAAPDGYIIKVA